MRVIVTGCRYRTDWQTIWADLGALTQGSPDTTLTVVHGANPAGADRHAADWCMNAVAPWATRGVTVAEDPHPADWDAHGKAAGPLRNATMADLGADLLLAYPGPASIGTWGTVALARKADISVRINRLPDDPPKRIRAFADRAGRQRAAGRCLPPGAVYVGRNGPNAPGRWGNRFVVGHTTPANWTAPFGGVHVRDAEHAVDLHRQLAEESPGFQAEVRAELAGHDLACWCAVDQPWCHATTLLALANGGQP